MKKLMLFLLFIFLNIRILSADGWQKIYNSGNYGLNNITILTSLQNFRRPLFIQLGCYITGYIYSCSVHSGSNDYYRLNKYNSSLYIPYGQFLKSSYCTFSIGSHGVCWCEPLDFFAISPSDSMFIIKYYNYNCYMTNTVKTYITYNGGMSNTEILSGYQLNGCFIDRHNDSIIIMGVNNAIKKSTDRGNTWFQISSIPELKFIESGGFIKQDPNMPSYIYAVGNNMYLSTNYGNSFSPLNLPPFSSIVFGQNGLVLGIDSLYLYKSSDYGLNWLRTKHNQRPNAFEISPDNNSILYLGNKNGLYKSTNEGNNWILYNNSFYPSFQVIGISKDSASGDTLYCATKDALYKVWAGSIIDTNIIPDTPTLFYPENGAIGLPPIDLNLSWNKNHRTTSYNLQVSADTVFSSMNYNVNLTDTFFAITNLLNLKWYYWRVSAKNNGGTSAFSSIWRFKTHGPPNEVNRVSPLNNSSNVPVPTVLICNKPGVQTFNIGKNINSQTIDSLPITYVFDIVRDTITLAGEIVRYLSDTIDIEPALLGQTKYYWRVRAYNSLGSSQFGYWWNFTTGLIGIKILSKEVPLKYALYLNYPNPFNPSTKIKFDIPPSKANGFVEGARGIIVRLIIYDALGREAAVLVNEQLNPGSYEVEFDGSNYPSGVYFYRLITADYTETKKMILLK